MKLAFRSWLEGRFDPWPETQGATEVLVQYMQYSCAQGTAIYISGQKILMLESLREGNHILNFGCSRHVHKQWIGEERNTPSSFQVEWHIHSRLPYDKQPMKPFNLYAIFFFYMNINVSNKRISFWEVLDPQYFHKKL